MKNEIDSLKNIIASIKMDISDASNFTIIYPNGGTESSPATITINKRYVEKNPFPGYYVFCKAQGQRADKWGYPGWHTTSAYGRFVSAEQLLPDDTIIIQTGEDTISGESRYDGNPFGLSNAITSIPVRVLVYKLGKIKE